MVVAQDSSFWRREARKDSAHLAAEKSLLLGARESTTIQVQALLGNAGSCSGCRQDGRCHPPTAGEAHPDRGRGAAALWGNLHVRYPLIGGVRDVPSSAVKKSEIFLGDKRTGGTEEKHNLSGGGGATKTSKADAKRLAKEELRRENLRVALAAQKGILDLFSWHRQEPPMFDLDKLRFSLRPHQPVRTLRWQLGEALSKACEGRRRGGGEEGVGGGKKAIEMDEAHYLARKKTYEGAVGEWIKSTEMARKIKEGGEVEAGVAIGEILKAQTVLVAEVRPTVEGRGSKKIRADIHPEGTSIVPAETTTVNASGKLGHKALGQAVRKDLYEDYVCSLCLACARDLFAVTPAEEIIVTAHVPGGGGGGRVPALSVHFPKEDFLRIDLEKGDPSEELAKFRNTGRIKASRTSGEFYAIEPLAFGSHDLPQGEGGKGDLVALESRLAKMRAEMGRFKGVIGAQSTQTKEEL
jgi:hypothetical protein